MNVAVVVNCLKIGGMERVAVDLADAFHDEGYHACLIYLKNRKKDISPKNADLPVYLFNLKKAVLMSGIGVLWFVVCKIISLFLKKTFPLFFAYAESYFFKRKLSQLEKQNGQPFDLIIFRGQGTFEHIWPIKDPRFVFVCESVQSKQRYKTLSKWVFSKLYQSRKVTCVSDGALNSFLDMAKSHNIVPEKLLTITNPCDFNNIRKESKTENILHNKPYILGLGRIVPNKNFSLLVDAYHTAVQNHKIKQDLVIVGDGKDIETVKAKVRELKLTDRVYFKGQQSNPFPWYQQADLFVLSSMSEGLGMVLIEALACSTKVVATNCPGGVRNIMNGDLAAFLSEQTPAALEEKIQLALSTSWDEGYAEEVPQVLTQFSASSIVNQYVENFR